MAFLLLSHLRAFAVVFKQPNSELFGYRQIAIVDNICGRCPHPQPLKRLTKLFCLNCCLNESVLNNNYPYKQQKSDLIMKSDFAVYLFELCIKLNRIFR